ncbi:type II toxin-antitoxin system RelE/ParE family toxin [Deinococcus sp. SM5_A1]|uniref:type II toxin-antitoxin system RelE family toxin n=1 Tax=Deinococcus sp. SM5_A1 TaxID=3379094 RepID=UPI00385FB1D8
MTGSQATGPHQITLTPKAVEMLEAVTDRREREALLECIEALAADPELQGKALLGELRGHRSVRAVGQRYRIVYRVIRDEVVVLVIGMGRRREGNRRDVYAQLERLDTDEREK